METRTFKILEDVAFLEGQGLLLLLIQHAVHGDELVVQGDDVREAHSRSDHVLRPANRRTLGDPSHRGEHAWENRERQGASESCGLLACFLQRCLDVEYLFSSSHFRMGEMIYQPAWTEDPRICSNEGNLSPQNVHLIPPSN